MIRSGVANPGIRRFCIACIRPKPFEFSNAGKDKSFGKLAPKDINKAKSNGEKPVGSNRFAKLYQEDKKKSHSRQNDRHPKPKHDDRRNQNGPRPQRRVLRFKFESGTPQAQDAVKDLIVSIHGLSSSYKVNYLNPENQQLERKFLHDIVNNTNFSQSGITFIHPSGADTLPIVKLCEVQQMITSYSRKLAQKKERELLNLGSTAAIRAANQRLKAEKKKSATKVMTMSWSISPGDLTNQKRSEIVKRLNKNESFIIYIGERSSLNSVKRSADKLDGVLNTMSETDEGENLYQESTYDVDDGEFNLELKKKELVVENLKEILEECQCQYDITGNIHSRLAIKCSASPNRKTETSVVPNGKELRKQKKLKKVKEEPKKTVSEDDLDSLYLFKIED